MVTGNKRSLTKVIDLRDPSREYYYTLPPEQAVVCAYYQYEKRNWNTWEYNFKLALHSHYYGTAYCGNMAALGRRKSGMLEAKCRDET